MDNSKYVKAQSPHKPFSPAFSPWTLAGSLGMASPSWDSLILALFGEGHESSPGKSNGVLVTPRGSREIKELHELSMLFKAKLKYTWLIDKPKANSDQ